MKYVYVITSSGEDYYLEQAIISIRSLLIYNPVAKVILITDTLTNKVINRERGRIKEYLSDIVSVDLPENLTSLQRSRFLKTSMRNFIEGDFWFIDTDTIFTDKLPEKFDSDVHIAAVLDKHLPIQEHSSRDQIIRYAKMTGWNIPSDGKYFNSGVMYVKDTQEAQSLFDCWHRLWLEYSKSNNLNIDQPTLAKANQENGYIIKELAGEYNCQIIENGIRFLASSKIIHYFASGVDSSWECPYLFRDKNIYKEIRENGITHSIENLIINARSAFISKCLVIGGIQTDIYGTPLMGIMRRVSRRFPNINKTLSRILQLIHKI